MLLYCCTLVTPVGQIIFVQCCAMKLFFLYQEINIFLVKLCCFAV